MDGMTGMEAAEELRKFDTDCMLIFQRLPQIMLWKVFVCEHCIIWLNHLRNLILMH